MIPERKRKAPCRRRQRCRCVGQHHISSAVGIEEAGHTQARVLAESERVEEIIVDAAVDHIHALKARGGTHIDYVVVHQEIAALDQFDAHLPRQECVLEIGRVENARREQARLSARAARGTGWSQSAQRGQQSLRVVIDGQTRSRGTAWGKPLQHFPVRQYVRYAAGNAQIVFEEGKAAVGQTDEIGAADTDVDSARNVESAHFAAEVAAPVHQFARDDTFRQDPSLVIDVFEEQVQGGEALGQAVLDLAPLCVWNDPRQQIVGEYALGALFVAIDPEGDALMQEREVGRLLALAKFLGGNSSSVWNRAL